MPRYMPLRRRHIVFMFSLPSIIIFALRYFDIDTLFSLMDAAH